MNLEGDDTTSHSFPSICSYEVQERLISTTNFKNVTGLSDKYIQSIIQELILLVHTRTIS